MKILITGFEPFGGEKINPAYEVVKKLKDTISDSEIIKIQVPVVFNSSSERIIQKIEETNPDAVLMIGQAGGRFNISVERVGINIDDAPIKDNEENQHIDIAIDKEGLPAHFSTLPIKAIVNRIIMEGIPASISNSAGTYICNHVLYGVLNYIYKKNLDIKAGFIHIPFLLEQALDKGEIPSMSLDAMVTAIEKTIEEIISSIRFDKVMG